MRGPDMTTPEGRAGLTARLERQFGPMDGGGLLTTTNAYGVRARIRKVDLLPNGKWRLEFVGGLVELRDVLA